MATLSELVRLDKSHIEPAAEMLTRAFKNYQMLEYAFPDEFEREKRAPYFFQYVLSYGVLYGEAYATSPKLEGVAVWLTSDNYPVTLWRLIRSGALLKMLKFAREEGQRMRYFSHIDAVHKRLAPFKHWFLWALGVDPQFQGKGYASKLLRPMFTKIDMESLPCYVETMDERGVSIYQHYGFEIVEKSTIPRTNLNIWAMLRSKP